MKEMDLNKLKESQTSPRTSEEIKISIGAVPKKDFVDHLFNLIMPKEHEIKYPEESEWKAFLRKMLRL